MCQGKETIDHHDGFVAGRGTVVIPKHDQGQGRMLKHLERSDVEHLGPAEIASTEEIGTSLLEKREKLWIELRFFQEVLEQITSGNRMKLNFASAIQNREAIPGRESGINQGLKLRPTVFPATPSRNSVSESLSGGCLGPQTRETRNWGRKGWGGTRQYSEK